MKIEVLGKEACVQAELHSIVRELSLNLPARRKWKAGKLYFELSISNIKHIAQVFPDAEWSDEEPLRRLEKVTKEGHKTAGEKRLENLPPEALAFPFKLKPFDHQLKAFGLSRDRKNFALFMEMGTGKSKVIIDTAAYLFSIGEIDTLMITAPNGVHRQWINEQIPEHMADFIPYNSISYQSNWTKKFCKNFDELMSGPPDELKIISFHVDAFSTKKGINTASNVLNSGKCLWVVDESVRIKNPSAQRTKSILRLAPLAPYRRILSGAPITQGVEDLYSQLKFLDEDILGFSSFWSFKSFFCVERPIPGAPPNARKIVGYQNLTTLQEALEGHSFRVVKADCLDLPEKLYMTREVPLTKEQIKAYEELKHDLVTQLSSGEIIAAPMAATKLMKMQQVLCGFLIPEVDAPAIPIPNNRISTALDIVKETQGKILLWARFHYDIDLLGDALRAEKIKFVEYHGRVSSENRVESLKSFKQDPGIKVFLANPQAGGTGLNLAEASTAIYYSNDFNADTRWQSEDRIHRIGQNNHCTYIDLVSPNTIDQHILKSLRAKKNVADSVLDVQGILEVL